MATAYPFDRLPPPPSDGPRALQTLEEFQREIRALSEQGLRDENFVRTLGGPGLLVRTPDELEAFIEAECGSSI